MPETITTALRSITADGYMSVEYRNAVGKWLVRFSSYAYADMVRHLAVVMEHYPEVQLEGSFDEPDRVGWAEGAISCAPGEMT